MILEAIAAGAIGTVSYQKTKSFVHGRLRYVSAVGKPSAPYLAGGAATLAAAPVVMLLPIVGGLTALTFGVAVGAGVARGIRRERLSSTTGL